MLQLSLDYIMLANFCASLLFLHLVNAHGFLYGPNGLKDTATLGSIRNYQKISFQIDDLRSPSGTAVCRNAPVSAQRAPVTLGKSGSTHTVAVAFSIGAMHVGECHVDIIDPATNKAVRIGQIDGPNGCARLGQIPNSPGQCPNGMPKNLITNDMCAFDWTFTLMNVEQITCTNCILRWGWSATHISTTNPELYQNCVDIVLTKSGGGGGGVAPIPAPQPNPKPVPQPQQPPATLQKPVKKPAKKAKQQKNPVQPKPPAKPAQPAVQSPKPVQPPKQSGNPNIGDPCNQSMYVCGVHDAAVGQDTLLVCNGGSYALLDHCDHGTFVCKVIGGTPYCI
ncbi:UNVERIFIED_CONTAM: hypothetical protein HDU68_008426 [Siphonaria sp. JEL0065]|nr:hypothetical protein HDU68_008426 [Siphonaria sp. JEL0065]